MGAFPPPTGRGSRCNILFNMVWIDLISKQCNYKYKLMCGQKGTKYFTPCRSVCVGLAPVPAPEGIPTFEQKLFC